MIKFNNVIVDVEILIKKIVFLKLVVFKFDVEKLEGMVFFMEFLS